MNPIKPALKTEIIPVILILLCLAASFYFYANFPETVPTHWNYKGEIDGWSSRSFAAFFFPVLILGMYLLFLGIPYLDPQKKRYQEFAKVYHIFKGLIIVFLALLYFYTGLAGLGYEISVGKVVPPAIGVLFIVLGNYLAKIKPNWFFGIRTPWTLSNEEVWFKTHRLGGKLFALLGLAMVLGVFFDPKILWFIFLAAVVPATFIPIIYSYVIFRQIDKK